jgi:pimeloyl-ACP methyl ester carboxylesterase
VTAAVELTAGPVEYGDTGGDGPAVVLLHGLVMDGRVWDDVVPLLPAEWRLLTPTLPFGAHRRPMKPGADLSLKGLGRLVAEFLEALDLTDVTLVFNDWGGAQVMIADGVMDRVGRLVLTPCEAFENYPPGIPGRLASWHARVPGGINVLRLGLRLKPVRNLPIAWGRMSKRGVPDPMMESWLEPLGDRAIRRDLARYAGDARRGAREMLAATPALAGFDKPVLVLWGPDDRLMVPANGRRLADAFPHARLVEVPGSYVLMPIDQPDALARALEAFVSGSEIEITRSSPPPRAGLPGATPGS